MITMIFEKTLGRKLIGAVEQSQAAKALDVNEHSPSSNAIQSFVHTKVMWIRLCKPLREWFRSGHVEKGAREPASKGKILNLMRY
jgi:hypothetical protein